MLNREKPATSTFVFEYGFIVLSDSPSIRIMLIIFISLLFPNDNLFRVSFGQIC